MLSPDPVNTRSASPLGSSKRVAHLTTVHSPFDVRIFHKECKSLARAGYDVTLIACHDKDETKDGVCIRAVPKEPKRLLRMTRGVRNVYREAVRINADLYHFHDPELLPAGLLLRLRGKRVVYDVHEDVSADIASKQYIPKGFRWFVAGAISMIEALASRILSAVTPATPRIATRFASRRLPAVLLSNYPVLEEFRVPDHDTWSRKSMAIAYVGVITRSRCIQEMTQAMSLLPESLGATLKLVGNFSPPSLAGELAAINGWKRTQVLGILDRGRVAGVLAEVRAGLVVLKATQAFVDSVPIKMFEYMCAGIPVIASNFPAFAETVNGAKCGLLVDPDDPQGIARAIEYVLTHTEEAEAMGKRGREAVLSKYNWANEEHKLFQLYRTLLDCSCAG